MWAAKVVMHEVQRYRVLVVLDFLRERIGQAREARIPIRMVRLERST